MTKSALDKAREDRAKRDAAEAAADADHIASVKPKIEAALEAASEAARKVRGNLGRAAADRTLNALRTAAGEVERFTE